MNALNSVWRTSSESGGNGNCVEVRFTGEHIEVRDTKDRDGGTLTFTREEWLAFTGGVHQREFELPA
jgi:hypothetical protein